LSVTNPGEVFAERTAKEKLSKKLLKMKGCESGKKERGKGVFFKTNNKRVFDDEPQTGVKSKLSLNPQLKRQKQAPGEGCIFWKPSQGFFLEDPQGLRELCFPGNRKPEDPQSTLSMEKKTRKQLGKKALNLKTISTRQEANAPLGMRLRRKEPKKKKNREISLIASMRKGESQGCENKKRLFGTRPLAAKTRASKKDQKEK